MARVVGLSAIVLSCGIVYASFNPVSICVLYASVAFLVALTIIPEAKELLIGGGLYGIDLNKKTFDRKKKPRGECLNIKSRKAWGL